MDLPVIHKCRFNLCQKTFDNNTSKIVNFTFDILMTASEELSQIVLCSYSWKYKTVIKLLLTFLSFLIFFWTDLLLV